MGIKNGFFKEGIQLENNTILKNGPIKPFWRIIFFLLIIALVIGSILIINFSITSNGLNLLSQNLKDFFSPSSYSELYEKNLFLLSISFLWNSIKLVFLSTFIGFILAMITAYFSNLKMNIKYVAIPFKIIIIFLRIFPELFFIYLFKISFDKALAINLIYCWFTWLWLHEYFSQTIENANFSIFFHITKTKQSKWKAFWIDIWPQIKIKFISHYIYAFEGNLRWSTILANFGYFGIGILLNPQEYPIDYTQLLIPLFVLVTFLVLLEISSQHINKFLFESKTINGANKKKYTTIKSIKIMLLTFFILIGIAIASFSLQSLIGQKFYKTGAISFFQKIFNPDWKNLIWNFSHDGIFWILLQFFSLIFLTFFFVYIISYFKMLLMAKSLLGKKVAWIFKHFNIFMRAIPVVVLFLLISNLFNQFSAAFVLAFSIHSSSSISRNLYQTINAVNEEKISELKKMKYGNFWIYRNYIRPQIKLDFITFSTFEIERITRNFITYGSLSSSILGQKTNITKFNDIEDIAPYLWIGFLIISLINLVSYITRLKWTNQKWI
ncbi:ABC transporter permease subunit [Metamycoplasma alkalescens]|uniref:Phosphonate transport system permease protein n=3 Tax=Metamycoplasma alkalescens TaxID=45363 RepID=A0A318U9W7_9BACT|nr:ABC transporter permease subunit [Metamycoplasma alkalescens]PYF43672.1 phosphonate transport system permease protein [Metamycoplasma alkalescens]